MSREKVDDLLADVARHLDDDAYALSQHARERMAERDIDLPEVTYVLRNGWHEKRKDAYQEPYQSWNYAVRGKTVDSRELRIVVSFDEDMLVVTAIDLD
jgi:hypothetical protein